MRQVTSIQMRLALFPNVTLDKAQNWGDDGDLEDNPTLLSKPNY